MLYVEWQFENDTFGDPSSRSQCRATLDSSLAKIPKVPKDSPFPRHPSMPRILGSLVSGMQHLLQKTQRVLCQQEQGQKKPTPKVARVHSSQHHPCTFLSVNSAGPSTPKIMGSLKPLYEESMWMAEATVLLGQGPFGPSSSARRQS